ncbi:MAG: phage holin family protein [Desulfobacterales bacterium]
MRINITRYYRHSHQSPYGPGGGGNPLIFWLLVRWLCLTAAIMLTEYLVAGIQVAGFGHALGAAMVLGVLNIILRPILFILTLPITIMTLGLFTFLINALMLKMASGLMPGFSVIGFWSAIFGALIISVINWLLNAIIKDSTGGGPGGRGGPGARKSEEYIDMKKQDDRWE